MIAFLKQSLHYIAGLAGIGAISGLAASHTVSGTAALPVLVAIVTTLVGAGATKAAGPTSSVTITQTKPTTGGTTS